MGFDKHYERMELIMNETTKNDMTSGSIKLSRHIEALADMLPGILAIGYSKKETDEGDIILNSALVLYNACAKYCVMYNTESVLNISKEGDSEEIKSV